MGESLKKSTINGVLWSSLERLSGQLIGFVVIVIMSRLLTQTDYGLVGMLMIFIDIAQTLVDSGVTQALIRKQDRSQADCSTAFYFNVLLSILLYLILFFTAPVIALFYSQPELVALTRVISLSIVINAFMMVQKALFTVNLNFKIQAKASVSAAIISGIIGIGMAYMGYGVWSIVYYQLANLILIAVFLWGMSSWRPTKTFSLNSFKYFFRFGSNLTIAGIMHTIYKNVYLVAIGKFYNAALLGAYTRAHQFGALPSYNVSNIVQRVTYPVLCRFQNNSEELSIKFKKILRLISFGVFPMMTGLAVLGEPLVVLLMGEKWSYSGTLLSILCFSMMWMPLDSLNLNLLQVRGRTDYFLRCEVLKKIMGFTILVVTLPLGLMVMCWGQVIRSLIDMAIDTYYTGKFLDIGLWVQIKTLFPTLLNTALMGIGVFFVANVFQEEWSKVLFGTFSGIFIYIVLGLLFKLPELYEIKLMINKRKL